MAEELPDLFTLAAAQTLIDGAVVAQTLVDGAVVAQSEPVRIDSSGGEDEQE